MSEIKLVNVSKSYGTVNVCHDINLAIADREFVTLLGSSGCGKKAKGVNKPNFRPSS